MQGTSEGSAEAYLTYAAQATKRVTPQRRLDPKPGVSVYVDRSMVGERSESPRLVAWRLREAINSWSAICLVVASSLVACTPEAQEPMVTDAAIPEGHPCPELAFAPGESSLWNRSEVAPLALRLPTPLGRSVRVSQGNHGLFSHFGDERFAWDFAVELGTPVHAAAGGVVVWTEDAMTSYGPEPEYRLEANFVVVDHGGGLFTSYTHLAPDSAEVLPGDVVMAGDVLAATGLSGQMTGPHLHFQVENVWSQSVPARFATPEGCTLLPLQEEWVTAWDVPLAQSDVLSTMPEDAFVDNAVEVAVGFPGRLIERDELYNVSGFTRLEGATDVWFLVLPADGGDAVFAQGFKVDRGLFSGLLDLSELAPGQYGVALVASTGGGVSVPQSVRTAIVR